jgi:hypothetical protein
VVLITSTVPDGVWNFMCCRTHLPGAFDHDNQPEKGKGTGAGKLKEECTVLVVSHDLYELEQQVCFSIMPETDYILCTTIFPDGECSSSYEHRMSRYMIP